MLDSYTKDEALASVLVQPSTLGLTVPLSELPTSAQTRPGAGLACFAFPCVFLERRFPFLYRSSLPGARRFRDGAADTQGFPRPPCGLLGVEMPRSGGAVRSRRKRLWEPICLSFLSRLCSGINFCSSKVTGACKCVVNDRRNGMFYKWISLWSHCT